MEAKNRKSIYKLIFLLVITVILIVPYFVFAANKSNYPDGTLIRAEDDPKVFIIHNGKKRWLRNEAIFNSYKHSWYAIKVLLPSEVNEIAYNNLIRADGIKVYALNDLGYKRHIFNPDIFNSYNLSWDDVADINQTELGNYPDCNLIKQAGTEKVYYIDGTTRKWVKTIEAFNTNNFNWDAVQIINGTDMSHYSEGPEITTNIEVNVPASLSITSVTPNQILNNIDNYLTISGTNFKTGATVKIGSQSATNATVINSTTISAKVAAGLTTGTYNIQVINSNGEIITLANTLTIISPPVQEAIQMSVAEISNLISPAVVQIKNDKRQVVGSGMIIDSLGNILTNEHVIREDDIVEVSTNGSILNGSVIGWNVTKDLAIVKINSSNNYVTLGNSNSLILGEDVVALGYPLTDFPGSVTVLDGILSNISVIDNDNVTYLQTTANIQHGSSGGPLVNMQGDVVGINAWCPDLDIVSGLCPAGYGLAIKVNEAKSILSDLKAGVKVGATTPSTPTPTTPTVGSIAVSANPTSILADGLSKSTISAIVKDTNSNVMPGQTVEFTIGSYSTSADTNTNGVASITYTASTVPGIKTVTVKVGSIQNSTQITETAVQSIELNISALSDPGSSLVVAGSSGVTVGSFSLEVKYGDVNIESIDISLVDPDGGIIGNYDEISSVALYLDGVDSPLGTTNVTSNNFTIPLSNNLTILANQTKTFRLKATFAPLNLDEVSPQSGAGIRFKITSIGTSTWGNVSINGLGTTFNTFTLFKSIPTITMLPFSGSDVIVGNSEVSLIKFKVSADDAHPISLFKFTFKISTTTVNLCNNPSDVGDTTGYYLYYSNSEGSYGNIVSRGSNTKKADMKATAGDNDFETLLETWFDVNDDNDGLAQEQIIINAGSSKYFTLRGIINTGHDGTADNESISTVLAGDAAFAASSHKNAYEIDALAENDFIWSDLNADQYAISSATTTRMFYNGYRVSGVPTTYTTPQTITD